MLVSGFNYNGADYIQLAHDSLTDLALFSNTEVDMTFRVSTSGGAAAGVFGSFCARYFDDIAKLVSYCCDRVEVRHTNHKVSGGAEETKGEESDNMHEARQVLCRIKTPDAKFKFEGTIGAQRGDQPNKWKVR